LRAEKGKKLGIFARLEAKWKGDNEENPLRGIETGSSPHPASRIITTTSDNEENPLRGIETYCYCYCYCYFLVHFYLLW